MAKIEGTKVLILNALRKKKHLTHYNLNEALEIIDRIRPEKAYLTHLSHLMGFHREVQAELPENVFLAYDGLKIEIWPIRRILTMGFQLYFLYFDISIGSRTKISIQ